MSLERSGKSNTDTSSPRVRERRRASRGRDMEQGTAWCEKGSGGGMCDEAADRAAGWLASRAACEYSDA